jgi:GT2 family glycosyltransferase
MRKPLVYVSVLVWNSEKWLERCFDSLFKTEYTNFQVVVVNNHSTDRGPDIIRDKYPQAHLITNKVNKGFAEGHNIGIRYALQKEANFVVILNVDTILDPLWLSELVDSAQEHPEFDIFAPMQYDYQGKKFDGTFRRIFKQNTQLMDDIEKNVPLKKIYALETAFAGALFFKRETLLEVGLFDPLYFIYCEEVDFFQRALFRGIKTALVTTSKFNHWHVGRNPEKKDLLRITYLGMRNRYMAMLKDPHYNFSTNMIRWVSQLSIDTIDDFSSWKGIFFAPFRISIQLWIVYHLPIIIYKRNLEKHKACYL